MPPDSRATSGRSSSIVVTAEIRVLRRAQLGAAGHPAVDEGEARAGDARAAVVVGEPEVGVAAVHAVDVLLVVEGAVDAGAAHAAAGVDVVEEHRRVVVLDEAAA